jgi:hypothetical protein
MVGSYGWQLHSWLTASHPYSLLVRVTSPRMATPPSKRTAPLTVSEVQWKREGTEGDRASSWSTSLQQGVKGGWMGGWVGRWVGGWSGQETGPSM